MKTYAIADLHGRFDILKAVVSKVHDHANGDQVRFIVMGDFIDRGPESAQIIEFLRDVQDKNMHGWEWIILKGNHEDMMVQCLCRNQIDWWLGNGGGETLKSYGYKEGDLLQPLKVPKDDIFWLNNLPVYHLNDKQAFVHAGFNPEASLEDQNIQEMMWQRAPRTENYSFLGRHVVHGHEQYEDGPVLNADKTNLDTFAWVTGRKAIGVFDDSQHAPLEILEVQLSRHKSYTSLAEYYGWDDD